MNDFERYHLQQLWKAATQSKIEPILHDEIASYHRYAKKPDNQQCFERYYSHLIPLHCYLCDTFLSSDLDHLSLNAANIESSFLRHQNAKRKNSSACKIIVLKGTIELAHGNVLKRQIQISTKSTLDSTILILIDYKSSDAELLSMKLGISIIGLGEARSIKFKYFLIACFALRMQSIEEIIWWGIPFGMIFTYKLIKELPKINNKFRYSPNSPTCSWLTVKHHFNFSNTFLDNIYTSVPALKGFGILYKPKITTFKSSFYSKESMISLPGRLAKNHPKIFRELNNLKLRGNYVMSSASRIEKTNNPEYLCEISKLLSQDDRYKLIVFGNSPDIDLMKRHNISEKQLYFCGWLSPDSVIDIISELNLFLDPFPFGAGMTFASAAAQNIPVISCSCFVRDSPSTVSLLYSASESKEIFFNDLGDCLFGTYSSYAKRANKLLEASDAMIARIAASQNKLVSSTLFEGSVGSVLEKNSTVYDSISV